MMSRRDSTTGRRRGSASNQPQESLGFASASSVRFREVMSHVIPAHIPRQGLNACHPHEQIQMSRVLVALLLEVVASALVEQSQQRPIGAPISPEAKAEGRCPNAPRANTRTRSRTCRSRTAIGHRQSMDRHQAGLE